MSAVQHQSEPAEFTRLLTAATRRAAALARTLEGRVGNVPKLSEKSAVKQALTEGDTRVQEALLAGLREHFPDVSLEAEEDTAGVSAFRVGGDPLVVIDPIDGTLHSYLEAKGPYAVMIGLAIGRRYVSSLIALPREGLLFGATRRGGAFSARVAGPPRPIRASPDGNRVLVSHGMPRAACAVLEAAGLEVIPACGGAIAVAPLILGVRAGLRIASSEVGVSIRGRIGALIAREAGARLLTDGGRAFPEDVDEPARTLRIATCDEDLAILARALEAARIG